MSDVSSELDLNEHYPEFDSEGSDHEDVNGGEEETGPTQDFGSTNDNAKQESVNKSASATAIGTAACATNEQEQLKAGQKQSALLTLPPDIIKLILNEVRKSYTN